MDVPVTDSDETCMDLKPLSRYSVGMKTTVNISFEWWIFECGTCVRITACWVGTSIHVPCYCKTHVHF